MEIVFREHNWKNNTETNEYFILNEFMNRIFITNNTNAERLIKTHFDKNKLIAHNQSLILDEKKFYDILENYLIDYNPNYSLKFSINTCEILYILAKYLDEVKNVLSFYYNGNKKDLMISLNFFADNNNNLLFCQRCETILNLNYYNKIISINKDTYYVHLVLCPQCEKQISPVTNNNIFNINMNNLNSLYDNDFFAYLLLGLSDIEINFFFQSILNNKKKEKEIHDILLMLGPINYELILNIVKEQLNININTVR